MVKIKKLIPTLTGLNIKASEVTDDQMTFMDHRNPTYARKFMKDNPTAVLVFVDMTNKEIVGVMQNNKNVKLDNNKAPYRPFTASGKDSKFIRNNKDQVSYTRGRVGGSTKDDKTGQSNLYAMSFADIINHPFYIIRSNDIKAQNYSSAGFGVDNKGEIYLSIFDQLRNKQQIYAQKIKDMRALARTGNLPDDLIRKGESLFKLGDRIIAITNNIIQNPSKFQYTPIDYSKTYGSGRSAITYTRSLLKKYVEAWWNLEDAKKKFESGDKYNLSDASQHYMDIENILTSLEKY